MTDPGVPAGSCGPGLEEPVRTALAELASGLRARFGARLVDLRLFGSHARGEADADSDVDVLVLLDRVSLEDDNWIFELVGALNVKNHVWLAPLIRPVAWLEATRAQEQRIALDIEADGIRL